MEHNWWKVTESIMFLTLSIYSQIPSVFIYLNKDTLNQRLQHSVLNYFSGKKYPQFFYMYQTDFSIDCQDLGNEKSDILITREK